MTQTRRNDNKSKPADSKQNTSGPPSSEQKSAPEPNITILNAVSAGSIYHIKCPKLNEVDKMLDDKLQDMNSASKPKAKSDTKASSSNNEKSQSASTSTDPKQSDQISTESRKSSGHSDNKSSKDKPVENKNKSNQNKEKKVVIKVVEKRQASTFDVDESDNSNTTVDKITKAKDPKQVSLQPPKKKIRLSTYRLKKATSADLIKSSTKVDKPKHTEKQTTETEPNIIADQSGDKQTNMGATGHNTHTMSESESEIDESRDPRFYRYDPHFTSDLPLPNFARHHRMPPNGPPVYPRARVRATDESFFDPRSGIEYIPVRRPEIVSSTPRGEYFYSDNNYLIPRSQYAPRRANLTSDFYYEDEPCAMHYDNPPAPIPTKYLGKADQNLINISPAVHIPTATVTSKSQNTPAAANSSSQDPTPSTSSQSTAQSANVNKDDDKKSDDEPDIMVVEPDLVDEYLVPNEEDTSAALPAKLALVTAKIWDQGVADFDALKVTESYEKLMRPANMDALVQTQINPEIQLKPQQPITLRDRQFRSIQSAVLKSTFGILKMMHAAYDPQTPVTHKQIIDTGIDTLRCLSYTNGRIHKLRRQNIRPVIQPSMRSICDKPAEKVSHSLLLGDDLKSKCKEMTEGIKLQSASSKIANKSGRKQNFRGRFRGFRRYSNRFQSGNLPSILKKGGGENL